MRFMILILQISVVFWECRDLFQICVEFRVTFVTVEKAGLALSLEERKL